MPALDAQLQADMQRLVSTALAEDIGSGDITAALIPAERQERARVISREAAIICGSAWFTEVFRQLDENIRVEWQVSDGDSVSPGQTLCTLQGNARSLLTGERTALNLLQTLSGTATRAHAYASAIAGTGAKVLDTRKTLPGLRLAQKYAVRCGGGANHRFGLDDAVLIKDNHVAVAGGVKPAVERVRRSVGHTVLIELEVDTLDQLEEALAIGVDVVLLDNMDVATLREAVVMVDGRAVTEASGGINLETAAAVAATGVDLMSVGALTHSAPALDIALDLEPPERSGSLTHA